MRRALSQQKIEAIFQYYLSNGFNHTTDEITLGMGISRKTFFNRYISKAHSNTLAIQHWHSLIQERFREKAVECNHPVEEILLFIWEIHNLKEKEYSFFEYEMQKNLISSNQSPFLSMLGNIIKKGIRRYHFQEDINIELYSQYLMHNLCHYVVHNENKEQLIKYLLYPLLTERGQELLEDVDVMLFL